MVSEATLPQWMQNAVGTLVVASIIALIGGVIDLRIDLADHVGDYNGTRQQLAHVEKELDEFRRPGRRFTAQQGQDVGRRIDDLVSAMRAQQKMLQECRDRYTKLEAQLEYRK